MIYEILTCKKDCWNLTHKSKFQKMQSHFQRVLIEEIIIIDIKQIFQTTCKTSLLNTGKNELDRNS